MPSHDQIGITLVPPKAETPLDKLNPLTRGMRLCFPHQGNIGTQGVIEYASNQRITSNLAGVPTWKPSPFGNSFDCGAGVNVIEAARNSPNVFVNDTNAITVYTVLFPTVLNAANTFLSLGMKSDNGGGIQFGATATQLGMSTAGNGISGGGAFAAPTIITGVWHRFGVSQQEGGAVRKFLLNGLLYADATAQTSSAIGVTEPWQIGREYVNQVAQNPWSGKIALLYVWSRALSNAELLEINRDPFQIFVRERSRENWSLYVAPQVVRSYIPQSTQMLQLIAQ